MWGEFCETYSPDSEDRDGLFCSDCGFEEDELYKYDGKKYCLDCLEKLGVISTHTVKSYCVNGEWFDDDEFYQALEYAGCEVIGED